MRMLNQLTVFVNSLSTLFFVFFSFFILHLSDISVCTENVLWLFKNKERMKKIIMLVMCLFLIGNLNAEVRRINLHMNKSLAGHERRIPIHVPCVCIENNVLFFDNSCVCSSISVLQICLT